MAAFREHVLVSSALGVGYAVTMVYSGMGWTHSALAAVVCAVAGMLPDLDSESGLPVRELFTIPAVAIPLFLLRRLQHAGLSAEGIILAGGGLYLIIRFGIAWLFKHLTVHRGMLHSLPAAFIGAEIVYLAHESSEPLGRLILAGGFLLGFLSHLLLDELYSVDARGLRIRKSSGSAFKLFSKNLLATAGTWLILGFLTYLVGIDRGYLRPLHMPVWALRT